MQRFNARIGRTTMAGFLLASSLYGCSTAQEAPNATEKVMPVALTDVADAKVGEKAVPATVRPASAASVAEPVTLTRIKSLPTAEQAAWESYWSRSQAAAKADKAALDAEVAANGMTSALQAPNGGDFKLPADAGDAWYAGEEAKRLADSILSYQTPSGGWSKHTGYSYGPRKPGMQWTSQNKPGSPAHYVATFDNRSTTEQLYFLAYVWNATKREDCKAAFIRGLDYVLAAQYPNGGWPQVYPLEGGYHDHITFNDDAMTRVLKLLKDVGGSEPYFAFLNESQRAKAAGAMAKGVECVLQLQVEQKGKKTVWCAQYDPITMQPSQARLMEPATLSGAESARVLDFLMSFGNPSPQTVAAIESGLAWFETSKLSQTADEGARWARFYDLKTSKPVFPGRDGVLYETFEAMAEKNKLGYDYYSTKPGSLLNTGQKKWRKLLARQTKG